MGWLIAFATALLESSKDIFHSQKKLKSYSGLFKAWVMTLCGLPFLVVFLAYKGIPVIQPRFWIVLPLQVVLLGVAQVLYMRALTLGPLSQTQPILGLTTLLLAVTNPIITRDRVSLLGWIGVAMVGVGIYATQHPGRTEDGKPRGFFAPFIEMWRQPGVMSKLAVAVIFSITANLDRLGLEASSGPFYLVMVYAGISAFLGAVVHLRMRRPTGEVKPPFHPLLLVGGGLNATTVLMHMWALTFLAVPYVIAIKRMSILLASLWGYVIRKDRAPHWYRILGMALVLGGVVIILLCGKAS